MIPEIFLTSEEADLIEQYLDATKAVRESQERREEIKVMLTEKFKNKVPFKYRDYNIQMTRNGVIPHKSKKKK